MTRGPHQADFIPKKIPSIHKLIFFPYTPVMDVWSTSHVMISFLNFYQDTWSQDLIYFHPWAAVQLMQDGILSLARPP
jgi:hypothetical protein